MLPSYLQTPKSRDLKDFNKNTITMQRKSCQNIFNETYTQKLPYIFIILTIASLLPSLATCINMDDYDALTIEESQADYRTELYENPTSINEGVDSDRPVKAFLGKFGYLKPADWNGISPRFINSGFGILSGAGDFDLVEEDFIRDKSEVDVGSGEEEDSDTSEVVVYKPLTYEDISHEEYQSAIMKYQKANGLEMTGMVDSHTKEFMEKPRCGVPDRTASLKSNITLVSLPELRSTENEVAMTTQTTTQQTEPSQTGADDNDYQSSGDEEDEMETLSRRRRSVDVWDEQITAGFEEGTQGDEVEEIMDDYETLYDVPEAEPTEESRLKSWERVLLSLRNETLLKEQADVLLKEFEDSPLPGKTPDLLHRAMLHARRRKRSITIHRQSPLASGNSNGWLLAYPKPVITWRLVREWPYTSPYSTPKDVRFTIKLAFRMWSEVLPRTFMEDNTSPMGHVDILLGFGKRRHNRCPVEFLESGYTNEYAHAWPLPKAEIHFNDEQTFQTFGRIKYQYSTVYNQPINLLMVALHEIGHTLGLPHTKDDKSVMNPIYRPDKRSKSIELAFVDRNLIQEIYGKCENPFDVVFDWVRPFHTTSGTKFKYNTFFFRKTWYWLYENKVRRPKYGEPRLISKSWDGVLTEDDPYGKIDAIIQLRGYRGFAGQTLIFKGDKYMEFDSATEKIPSGYPRRIADDFPGIPYPLDTAIYRFEERLIYFFKGALVYKYDYETKRVKTNRISQEFPGWGGALPLPSNINAAYYSYQDRAYYFFKGKHYWRMADKRDRLYNKGKTIPLGAVGPKMIASIKWRDLCDVHPTELPLTLPSGN